MDCVNSDRVMVLKLGKRKKTTIGRGIVHAQASVGQLVGYASVDGETTTGIVIPPIEMPVRRIPVSGSV